MTTLSIDVGRMDVLLHRGVDDRVGVHWEEDKHDGNGYVGKDIRDWTALFELLSPGGDVLYAQDCHCDRNGFAAAFIPAAAFTADVWKMRRKGTWRIRGHGPRGETELLGWGSYEMAG